MKRFIFSRINIPIFISLISVLGCLAFFRIYLYTTSSVFIHSFESSNYKEFASGDMYSLTARINAVSGVFNWVCVEATKGTEIFLSQRRGDCRDGVFRRRVQAGGRSGALATVRITFGLPPLIEYTGLFFIGMQCLLMWLLLRIGRIIDRERHSHELRLGELAAQVAHDIRSPLAALQNVAGSLQALPEDDRILVRMAISRIRDISNNLIEKNRELKDGQIGSCAVPGPRARSNSKTMVLTTNETATVQLLSSLVDSVVSEKRLQYRTKIGIEIESRIGVRAYGVFGNVQPTEFKRVLSNLINNAVEAIDESGLVTVVVAEVEREVEIRISDNGKGIPSTVLPRLGQRGETHGKAGGSGLGLYHARMTVESFRGRLALQSKVGKGTVAIITLPKAEPPDWFVPELRLMPHAPVVVFDDDPSIFGMWQKRLDSLHLREHGIGVFHFSVPEELVRWVREPSSPGTVLYLIDYEIRGHDETGLSLIESLKISAQSILVTSRFEEKWVLEECLRLGVRLLPKGLVGDVPIRLQL